MTLLMIFLVASSKFQISVSDYTQLTPTRHQILTCSFLYQAHHQDRRRQNRIRISGSSVRDAFLVPRIAAEDFWWELSVWEELDGCGYSDEFPVVGGEGEGD
jgi:hypothetical protein